MIVSGGVDFIGVVDPDLWPAADLQKRIRTCIDGFDLALTEFEEVLSELDLSRDRTAIDYVSGNRNLMCSICEASLTQFRPGPQCSRELSNQVIGNLNLKSIDR